LNVSSRIEKLKRIERLQKRLHDLSMWKLTHLAEERDKLTVAHAQMIQALGEGLLSFGGAASAATRRIRSIEMEINAAHAAHAAQAKRALENGARSKLAEKVAERAEDEGRRETEKKTLFELIEWSLQSSISGSHKP
jgi:hypothetical protein